jgi:dihydroneopterin aldolase
LVISGLRIYSYSGYAAAERELGQWFEIEFEVWGDLQPAARSGQLDDTYDYRRAIEQITQLLSTQSFLLIESMAESIASLLLYETQAPQVRVKLSKCHPPIPGMTGSVTVEIQRRAVSPTTIDAAQQERMSSSAE